MYLLFVANVDQQNKYLVAQTHEQSEEDDLLEFVYAVQIAGHDPHVWQHISAPIAVLGTRHKGTPFLEGKRVGRVTADCVPEVIELRIEGIGHIALFGGHCSVVCVNETKSEK